MNPGIASTAILAFLKAPVPGTVKTRLARTLGEVEATRIYRWLVERQMENLPANVRLEIHYSPAEAGPEMKDWLGRDLSYHPQCGGDLGERMRQGFRSAFRRGAAIVFAIGGDCPDLNASDFEKATELLSTGNDLVFGPAEDGGYYLLGMRRFCPEVFDEIPWSAAETLEKSLKNADAAGRRTAMLSMKNDVDEVEDWEKAKRLIC